MLAGASPVTLSVGMSALSDAFFTNPFIIGSPPEDGAGSEGFGHLTFTADLIPETSGLFLLLSAAALMAGACHRRNRI
jgi:hypothetical protein